MICCDKAGGARREIEVVRLEIILSSRKGRRNTCNNKKRLKITPQTSAPRV